MSKLTKNQLTRLGSIYLKLAQTVGNYRINNYDKLSPIMKKRIREYHKKLIDYSDSFYVASTNYIMEQAEDSIKTIEEVTTNIETAIHKIQKTQTVVNAIGSAVQLGASIISHQPIAIGKSIAEFVKVVKKIKKPQNKTA